MKKQPAKTPALKRRNLLIAVLTGITVFTICAALAGGLDQYWRKGEAFLLNQITTSHAVDIERRLSRALSAAYILGSEVRHHNGALDDFEPYAQELIDRLGAITNLQLAPNAIIRDIYPLPGHEKALGLDLRREGGGIKETLRAIKTRQLTLVGPIELAQGGASLIGRQPVFLETDNGEDTFWGFASVLIYLDELISAAELDQLQKEGYRYRLSRINPITHREEVFAGTSEPFSTTTVTQNIQVPGGEWKLYVTNPNNSFHELSYWIVMTLAMLGSALIGFALYWLLRQPMVLQKTVAEKTGELEQLAYYDALTGLYNRRFFSELLKKYVASAIRRGDKLALLYLDLDNFKLVNDTQGHDAGDELIKIIAQRLNKALRSSDIFARIGGDEFTILLRHLKRPDEAGHVAEKLFKLLEEPVLLRNREVSVSASIGITLIPDDANHYREAMKNADLAMYAAKETGRNGYCFFDREMDRNAHEQLLLENQLRTALSQNQFLLHYQPIYNLAQRKVVAFEALVRWQHPERGLIYPGEFIDTAERTGLIIPLGQWVLECACREIGSYLVNRADIKLSVNLSPQQFNSPALTGHIRETLEATGFPARGLQLEVTESMIMENVQHAAEVLSELQQLGISIAIDDFGTGYSSLSKLKQLPVDVLKIDRSFIRDIPKDHDDMEIVELIITLAKKLRLTVVAEGIESETQIQHLVHSNCLQGQGFLLSKPQPISVFTKMIEEPVPT